MGNQFSRDFEQNDAEYSNCCQRLFKWCFQRPRLDFGTYDIDEYDYIVEKLAIKYVKVSMFATSFENYDYNINNQQSQYTSTILSASVQASSTLPKISHKIENTSKAQRKLRFSKRDCISGSNNSPVNRSDSVKKPSLAHSIGGTSPVTELMNSLTAFHPNLKKSECPPKDPYSLNTIKSQRSFAEELSELASTNNYNDSIKFTTKIEVAPGTSKQL